ncbi:MAG TPA: DUF2089 domain-containing protein [Candidatus Acidoferrum sp.]|nr:DUF2089 domain-containing protein [Candidatus Acidoferrum sp.]
MSDGQRTAPNDCPVCGGKLAVTRLSCRECGTELSGAFETSEFSALGKEDRQILRVFLASRGNMKELERYLGVSYPTARARFDALLGKLGLSEKATPDPRLSTLEQLARGEIDIDEADRRLT